jgi:hypothetical protein
MLLALDEIKTHDSLVRSQGCVLRRAARDHEIADRDLHGLAVLI